MWRGVWILFGCLLPVVAQALSCSVCGREIHGQYLRAEGKILCSAECWEKLLPRCSLCGAPLSGRYVKFEPGGEERLFCLKCSELPRCFSCDLPTNGTRLPDGRILCPECSADVVQDPDRAEALYRRIEREVFQLLGSPGCGRTAFGLCTLDELNHGRKVTEGAKFELGRCLCEQQIRSDTGEVVSTRCTVGILGSLPEAQFIEVAAHEAAHDWLNHHAKPLPPEWNEGFAEYVASLVNDRHGHSSRNRRMEENPDPVYGDGFRLVRDYAGEHGLPALLEKLQGGR